MHQGGREKDVLDRLTERASEGELGREKEENFVDALGNSDYHTYTTPDVGR